MALRDDYNAHRLTARDVAKQLGISVNSVHCLCRETKTQMPRLVGMFYGDMRLFSQAEIDAYLASEDAQKRRRPSWRQDQEAKLPPLDTSPKQVAGHNLPAQGSTGALSYVDASGKLSTIEVSEKHIIHIIRTLSPVFSTTCPLIVALLPGAISSLASVPASAGRFPLGSGPR